MNLEFIALINNVTYHMSDSNDYRANFKHGWQTYINAADNEHDKSGFYASSFVNHQTKQLILSYSGTTCFNLGWNWDKWYNCLQDIYTDVEMYLGYVPMQMPYAQKFTDFTFQLLEEDVGSYEVQRYAVTLTGHSLGATLANLMAIHLHNKGLKANILNFESPGSKPALDTFIVSSKSNITLEYLNIHTHNTHENWINTLNPEVGEIHTIHAMPYGNGTVWDGIMSTWIGHQMSEILSTLVANIEDHIHLPSFSV